MYKKTCLFYLFELLTLFIIIALVSVFYLNQRHIDFFFNSDILVLPDLFKDLAQQGDFKNWFIPTTAMFFPDWLIFFIAFIMTPNVYFQMLIAACLNMLLLYAMVRLIYSQFFPKKEAFIFSCASFSIFLFFALEFQEPYSLAWVVTQHVGAFMIGFLYVFVQMQLIEAPENPNRVSLLIFSAVFISLAMGLSDLLFIIQFSLPVFLVYLFLYIKRQIIFKKVFSFSLVPLCFSLGGGWLIPYVIPKCYLWDYLNHPSLSKISLETIKVNSHFIINHFKMITPFFWLALIVLFYSLMVFILTIILLTDKYPTRKYIFLNQKNIFFSVFLIFSTTLTILSFISVKINPTLRYLEPVFFSPLLFFFYWSSFFKKNHLLMQGFIIFALLVLLYGILTQSALFYKRIFTLKTHYYPEEVACVDHALEAYHRDGIAQYWTARPFSMLSQKKLRINAVLPNLTPFLWATNVERVKNAYSFAILDKDILSTGKLDQTLIENTNGPPKKIVICGSKKLLIYANDHLKTPVFIKKGDEFSWWAADLPSQFPDSSKTVSRNRRAKSTDIPAYLSFGPYITLSQGRYHFFIRYASKALPSIQTGFYDIFSVKSGVFSVASLFGTKSKSTQIKGEFYVNRLQENDPWEIRVYFSGGTEFTLETLTLVKDE